MSKEEKNSDSETEKKTTKKLFVKGGLPGPGRGHTREEEEIALDGELYETVERVIRRGMASKDDSLRLKAASLGVRLEGLRKANTEEKSVLSPEMEFITDFVVEILLRFERKDGVTFPARDAMHTIVKHMRDCPDSPYRVADDPVEYEEPEDDTA